MFLVVVADLTEESLSWADARDSYHPSLETLMAWKFWVLNLELLGVFVAIVSQIQMLVFVRLQCDELLLEEP